jgi:alkylhydroperoxidase family enzyme
LLEPVRIGRRRRQAGLQVEGEPLAYDELLDFASSGRYSERETAALDYTNAIVWDANLADDALWERLHRHFTEPELVELGFFVALTLGQQRWIKTLGIGHRQLLADTDAGLAPTAVDIGIP